MYYKKRNVKSRDGEEYYTVLQRKVKIAKAEKKAKQYKEEVGKLVKDRNSKKKETRPKAERKLENIKKRKEALEAIDPENRILAENDTDDDTIIETVLDKIRDMQELSDLGIQNTVSQIAKGDQKSITPEE
ncbi:hypothetical protein EG327_009690 [Venturia inaequalis]|uniref:Uncharacterized protein n=1 Tax=Venturia inaequalis TaxID=5025 RepID=A0A8H3UMB3_VENIN|nr:hypothetical protein EG327_009690 [Venturia inaequalis]